MKYSLRWDGLLGLEKHTHTHTTTNESPMKNYVEKYRTKTGQTDKEHARNSTTRCHNAYEVEINVVPVQIYWVPHLLGLPIFFAFLCDCSTFLSFAAGHILYRWQHWWCQFHCSHFACVVMSSWSIDWDERWLMLNSTFSFHLWTN